MKTIWLGLFFLLLSGLVKVNAANSSVVSSSAGSSVNSDDVEYVPDDATLSTMTQEKACHDFMKYGKKVTFIEEEIPKQMTDLRLISGGFEYDFVDDGPRKTITLFSNVKMLGLREMAYPTPDPPTALAGYIERVFINTTQGGNRFLWFDWDTYYLPHNVKSSSRIKYSKAQRDARLFLNALYALVHHPAWTTHLDSYQYVDDGDDFDTVVKKYHAHKGKMLLSQEVRKFYIQAQDAVNEKRYDDAIDLYNSALEAAPWWALGYYNCGVIMADQDDYDDAIDYLKKYLKLEPKASDAQTVQDKIYSLEGKQEKEVPDNSDPNSRPAGKAF